MEFPREYETVRNVTFRITRLGFRFVPRPINLRVVYDVEGVEPTESRYVVREGPPAEGEDEEEP